VSGKWVEGLVLVRKLRPLLLDWIASRHRKPYTEGSLGYKLRTQVKKGNCSQDLSAKKLKDYFQHNEAGVAKLMSSERIKISQSSTVLAAGKPCRMGSHTRIKAFPQQRYFSALLQPLVNFGHDLYLPVRLISIHTATFIWAAVDCSKFRPPKRSQLV
jgi:hypothetical protein